MFRRYISINSCLLLLVQAHIVIPQIIDVRKYLETVPQTHARDEDIRAKYSKQFPIIPISDYEYNDELCLLQTAWFFEQLNQTEDWAMRMFDSWGKIPVGLYYGNHFEFGNFEECLATSESNFLLGTIRGQYCTITATNSSEVDEESSAEVSNALGLQLLPHSSLANDSTISVGICVPASCDPEFAKTTIDTYLSEYNYATTTYNQADYCHRNELAAPWTSEIYGITFFAIVGALLLLSTAYDVITSATARRSEELLTTFSLWTNGKSLFSLQQNGANYMECLNGIRVLSIVWIIFSHSYMIAIGAPNVNAFFILDWIKNYHSMLVGVATLSVDTFFVISGALVTVSVLRELNSRKTLNYPLYILHRFLRLTPAFGALIIFYVTVLQHFGDGPLWKPFLRMSTAPCRENWWSALLFIQNYYNPEAICIGHSWYLSVDMQLYILSPLLIYPIWRCGLNYMLPCIVTFILVAMGCVFATFIANDFRLSYLVAQTRMAKTYYPTHIRMGAWLVGIVLGYYLYKYKNTNYKMSKVGQTIGWTISLGIIVAVVLCFYPFQQLDFEETSVASNAVYEALNRVCWAIAVAWLILCCELGYGGFINTFLGARWWLPLSKLSYCIYLLHLPIQSMTFGSIRTTQFFSDFQMVRNFWGDFGTTVTVAILWHLAFECPIICLERVILRRTTIKKPTVKIIITGTNSFRETNHNHCLRTRL